MNPRYAAVVVDVAVGGRRGVFDYAVPPDMAVTAGARVIVPFGKRDLEGFVLDLHEIPALDPAKIKPIKEICGTAKIKPEFLTLLDEISGAFKLRYIDILHQIMPAAIRARQTPKNPEKQKVREKRQIRTREIAETKDLVLTDQQLYAVEQITAAANLPENSKETPAKDFHESKLHGECPCGTPQTSAWCGHLPNTNLDAAVFAEFAESARIPTRAAKTFVLHGVTGSGKTEVYMNVIKRVLDAGRSAIMLVPEIGLTPQVLAVFRARFGDEVAVLHSGLTPSQRYDEWLKLYDGRAHIALGARSAIFAPLENLGVIIIDEEHDGSYASESNPRFSTHEIAAMRARRNGCPIVLGSATPSVETYYRAKQGEYELLRLDRRVNDLSMPQIEIVNMAHEVASGGGTTFSRAFTERLLQTLADGKQAIIFQNRRGFSSFVMCCNCGWVAKCPNCDVSLVYHKEDRLLKCHYCAARFSSVTRCPECESTYLKFGATGTQKIAEELGELLKEVPNAAVFRMDADSTKTKDAHAEILDKFARTPSSVLVGTQMIAKGHHFPDVALVGIVDADTSLHFSDFRAAERTFALITQVAGRAGRSADTGHVVLQTYMPNHYVYRFAANYDYEKFFDKEINTRMVTKYPPFTAVVRVLVTAAADAAAKEIVRKIMADLRTRDGDFVYLGAMKSPMGRLQNKFRYQVLARIAVQNAKDVLNFMDTVVSAHQTKSAQIFLEVNPQSLS